MKFLQDEEPVYFNIYNYYISITYIERKFGWLIIYLNTLMGIYRKHNNVWDNKAYLLVARTHFPSFLVMVAKKCYLS